MKRLKILNRTVEVPETASEWELYSSMQGVEVVAKAMTEALKDMLTEVLTKLEEGYQPSPAGYDRLMQRYMYPVAEKYSKFGASDSEPCYHALLAVQKAVKGK